MGGPDLVPPHGAGPLLRETDTKQPSTSMNRGAVSVGGALRGRKGTGPRVTGPGRGEVGGVSAPGVREDGVGGETSMQGGSQS